jgi:hypothetical protein
MHAIYGILYVLLLFICIYYLCAIQCTYNTIYEGLSNDTSYIFGYGSLVNTESRNSTSVTLAQPVIIHKEFSYIRHYNTSQPKLPPLGLVKITDSTKQMPINGVLFKVNEDQLKRFDKREGDNTRIRVPTKYIESFDKTIDSSLPIYAYIPKPKPYCNNCTKPINYNYIQLVSDGFKEYGVAFYNLFVKTTQNLPKVN